MARIDDLFAERARTPHNIDVHLPLLRALADDCNIVTEFGTDIGFSTTAFIAARPLIVRCYDLRRTELIDTLEEMAQEANVRLEFHQVDTRLCPVIEPTDLLFIDSNHTYSCLKTELFRHADRAEMFLAFHDTIAFPGIVPAIEEYLAANPEWKLTIRDNRQSGLWVCERKEAA